MAVHMDLIIIGAGQAGLALGYYLRRSGLRFLLLDRAPAPGHSWRNRYDSLRLFTPAQYNSLPGLSFPALADHYPTKEEVADYLDRYARHFDLPVKLGVAVERVEAAAGEGYRLLTSEGEYLARQVMVATGPFDRPFVPPLAADLDPAILQMHSSVYRNPAQLRPGPVLVVGGGNSGAQIAEELAQQGRQVTLSMGESKRYVPNRILGRDLFWWLSASGLMRAATGSWLGEFLKRRDPLIGTDMKRLQRDLGVVVAGRAVGAAGRLVHLAGGRSVEPASVIWATGFRPGYDWIHLPVFDQQGVPVHRRGVTSSPGLYFLGLAWQHTRGSALLGFVGADAAYLAQQIAP